MRVLAVVPVVDIEMAQSMLASAIKPRSASGLKAEDILVVDNTRLGFSSEFRTHRDVDGHNMGVARSWNVGVRDVLFHGYDYLIIMSQSLLWGQRCNVTFVEQIERNEGALIVEAHEQSWHLIAIHRTVFETVGLFDENFYPAYYEDVDFGRRLLLHQMNEWPHVNVNVCSRTFASHSYLALAAPLIVYYGEKWGGQKCEEAYELPFGDMPIGYYPERSIPDLAAAYGLTEWW